VVLFDGTVDQDALRRAGLMVVRLLDHYHIVYDLTDTASRAAPELVLFDRIAIHYEKDISLQNNLETIRMLLSLAMSDVRVGQILDYGCGTGLSSKIDLGPDVHIFGFDRSPTMRALARLRGLEVLAPEQLYALPEASIDGMIASYVLHLASAMNDLHVAAGKLRLRAKLTANFHKGTHMNDVDHRLESLGYVPLILSENLNAQHIVAWERVRI
jgi:SAM-dependent methyltransferase